MYSSLSARLLLEANSFLATGRKIIFENTIIIEAVPEKYIPCTTKNSYRGSTPKGSGSIKASHIKAFS